MVDDGGMSLLFLKEDQNEAFDEEYHSREELDDKIAYLRRQFPGGVRSILDIGGGNGHFMDSMLDAFPAAEGWILDVSQDLLDRNRSNPRKHLVRGSAGDLATLFADRRFDVITINWVLHHLVASSYAGSRRNVDLVLRQAADMLTPGGVLLIAENEYQGFLGTNVPSRLIFGITRVENPRFVRLARRFFNTAGVGVCFQSERSWRDIFRKAGFDVPYYFRMQRWRYSLKKRLMFAGLFMASYRHGHFGLRRTTKA